MKKNRRPAAVLAAFLAAAAIGCLPVSALAASQEAEQAGTADIYEEVTRIEWEDAEAEEGADELLAEGDFYSLGDTGRKMWIPNFLKPTRLTAEDTEAGYIGLFITGTPKEGIFIREFDAGVDLTDYKAELEKDEDVYGTELLKINEALAVGYNKYDGETSCLAFPAKDGHILEISFCPGSNEDFADAILFMAASIQEE